MAVGAGVLKDPHSRLGTHAAELCLCLRGQSTDDPRSSLEIGGSSSTASAVVRAHARSHEALSASTAGSIDTSAARTAASGHRPSALRSERLAPPPLTSSSAELIQAIQSSRLGDPSAPVDLVVGASSGILVDIIDKRAGRRGTAMSVDVLPCESTGMHVRCCARRLVFSRRWRRVFIFMPCTHLANSGAQYFEDKAARGLCWYAMAVCAVFFCAPASMVIMENSDGLLKVWRRADQALHPYFFGKGADGKARSKKTLIWRRGVYHDIIPTDMQPPPYHPAPGRDVAHANSTERMIERSRSDPGMMDALDRQYDHQHAVPHARPSVAVELALAADGYTRRFGAAALPADWADVLARPPEHLRKELETPSDPLEAASFYHLHNESALGAPLALRLWRRCTTGAGLPHLHGDVDVRRPDPRANPFPTSGAAGAPEARRGVVVRAFAQLDASPSTTPEALVKHGPTEWRGLQVHSAYAGQRGVAERELAYSRSASAAARGDCMRLMCQCPLDGPCHRDVVRSRIVRDAFIIVARTLHARLVAGQDDRPAPGAQQSDGDRARDIELVRIAAAVQEADEAEAAEASVAAAITADLAEATEAEAAADMADAMDAEAVVISTEANAEPTPMLVDAGVVTLHRGAGRGRGWNRFDRDYPLLAAPAVGRGRARGRGGPAGRAVRLLTLAAACSPTNGASPVGGSASTGAPATGVALDYAALMRPAQAGAERSSGTQVPPHTARTPRPSEDVALPSPADGIMVRLLDDGGRTPTIDVSGSLAAAYYVVLVVAVLGAVSHLVAVPSADGLLFGAPSAAVGKKSRDSDVATGLAWARTLVTLPTLPVAWLAGELDAPGGAILRLIILPIVGSADATCVTSHSRWVRPCGVHGVLACTSVQAALARAVSFVRAGEYSPLALRVGRGATMSVHGGAFSAASLMSFDARVARLACATVELRVQLTRAAKRHHGAMGLNLSRLSERVLPIPIGEIPTSLRGEVCLFDDPSLDLAPFRHDARIPHTRAPPAPPSDRPVAWPPGLTPPQSHADVLEAWCFEACCDRLDSFDAWHCASMDAARAVRRPCGEVFGLMGVRPQWRPFFAAGGSIDFTVQPPVPFGDGHAFTTHVNQANAAAIFDGSRDEVAASWWLTGVRPLLPLWHSGPDAPDDVAVFALAPNLMSTYPDAAAPIAEQLGKFAQRKPQGWLQRAAMPRDRTTGMLGLPSVPFGSSPEGGVKKKGTIDPRVINAMGWPPKPLRFTAPPGDVSPQAVFQSINVTSGDIAGGDPQAHGDYMCKETKASIAETVNNSCVIGRGCELGGLIMFELSFDFEKWFHQFHYWWREVHRMGGILPDLGADGSLLRRLVAVLNWVMAMGWTWASGIAQRMGNLIVREFLLRLDASEREHRHEENAATLAWLNGRSDIPHDEYGAMDRLWDASIFTDDPKVTVASSPVGAPGGITARIVRASKVWLRLVGEEGLDLSLAKHVKWMCGVWSKWIGACFCPSLGLVWLSPDKALRAASELYAFAQGKLMADEVRSLLGFLNHVGEVLRVHPYLNYHMWQAFDRHVEAGHRHDAVLKPSAKEIGVAHQWRSIVLNTPGTTMMRARAGRQPPYGLVTGWPIRSDACFDGTCPPAMGGDWHGNGWIYVFTPAEQVYFTIPIAEFVAGILHLMFVDVFIPEAKCRVMEVDALATPTSLAARARSPGMVAVHEEFMASAIFARLMFPHQRLATRHIFGGGNPGGDLRSRGRHAEADALARQLGQTPRLSGLPREALDFLQRIRVRLQGLRPRPHTVRCDPVVAGGPAIRSRQSATTWRALLAVAIFALPGVAADVRGHLVGEPAARYYAGLGYVEYPTPRPGRPLYDRAELLQELQFCQGYHPEAHYVVQVHDVAFDGALTPRSWRSTTVAEIRWYIEQGRFLQHWFVSDPVEEDARAATAPPDAYDAAPPDYYDSQCLECDLCGGSFDAGSIDGTRDWRGTGMDCCGCGNECGLAADSPRRERPWWAIARRRWHTSRRRRESRYQPRRRVRPRRCDPVVAGGCASRFRGSPPPQRRPRSPTPGAGTAAVCGIVGFRRARGPSPTLPVAAPPVAPPPATAPPSATARRHVPALRRQPRGGSPLGGLSHVAICLSVAYGAARPAAPSPTATAGAACFDVGTDARASRREPREVGVARTQVSGPSAKAARKLSRFAEARVEVLMEINANSTHPWALRPRSPEALEDLLRVVARFYERSAPDSTLDTEASNWNWWLRYCSCSELWREPNCAMRPDRRQLSYEEQMLEETLWAGAVPWIHRRMRSRAGVVGAAKPSSVMNVLRGVRRAHLRQRVDTVSLQAAVRACGGLMRDYIELHGPDALMPHRKEPLTNPLIRGLLTLADGSQLARGKHLYWSSPRYSSLRALYATLAQTGMRKAEVSLSPKASFGRTHLTMANVRWMIGGRVVDAPTAQQLAAMVDGDYALLRPPPSKADQFSLHWGASTIYLKYYASASAHPICAARELRAEEARRAVPATRRSLVPLFVCDNSDTPWTHGPLTDTFGQMMAIVCGSAEAAACYSMHSFRIYLACALLSAGASNGTIQTMLRWRSDDALRIYARINDSKYAEWLTLAGSAEVSSIRTTTTDVVRRMEQAAATAAGGAAGFGDHWMEAAAASDATFDNMAGLPQHDADTFVRALRDDASTMIAHAVSHDAADNAEFNLASFPSPWT